MTLEIVRTLNTKISALLQMGAGPTLAEAISLMSTVALVEDFQRKLMMDNMDID
jgi:hypothetical protein